MGSRLGPVLTDLGHQITSVDRGYGDLTYESNARELVGRFKPEVVVHLAANPGRVFGEHDAMHTVMTNTVATINVAKACTAVGAALCYVSTSEVYGTACDGISLSSVREDTPLGRPLNLYGATKRWGEEAAELYAPMNLQIIRPSMPFGPGMATGVGRAALPSMIAALLTGEQYTVHAATARSWCYVDDLVRGMADVIERGSGVYNVGRDDDLRYMVDVAHLVCDVLNLDIALINIGQPDASITRVKDISTARLRSLGWSPTVDLVEGIELTAASLRS